MPGPSDNILDMGKLPLDAYLARLASDDAVPGGGAAVAVTAAQAAALLSMALAVTTKVADTKALAASLDGARTRLLQLATDDGVAFRRVMDAMQLPQADAAAKAARKTKLQAALKGAAAVPFQVLEELQTLAPLADAVAKLVKPAVASDVAVAVQLADAATKSAVYNVEINLKYIDDAAFKSDAGRRLEALTEGRKARRKALIERVTAHFKR